MSAFICTDKHFTIIAKYVALSKDTINAQDFANRLKTINIKSVNWRYNEKNKITKCKLYIPQVNENYTKFDIIRLIQCWDYQSCKNYSDIDFNLMQVFLYSIFDKSDIENARNNSNLWCI